MKRRNLLKGGIAATVASLLPAKLNSSLIVYIPKDDGEYYRDDFGPITLVFKIIDDTTMIIIGNYFTENSKTNIVKVTKTTSRVYVQDTRKYDRRITSEEYHMLKDQFLNRLKELTSDI